MKKALVFSVLLIFGTICCQAQYETDTHAFWQSEAKLTFEMFQGIPVDSAEVKKLISKNLYNVLYCGFWSKLDVPATKRGWKKHSEIYSFCAAVDKKSSYLLVRDSTELKYAQLLWDLCEVATRMTRRELAEWKDSIRKEVGEIPQGFVSLIFQTCVNDGKQFGKEMTYVLFDQVIAPRNEDAYQSFRSRIDQWLAETEKYATTEDEIKRFAGGSPQPGYKEASLPLADYRDRGVIKY